MSKENNSLCVINAGTVEEFTDMFAKFPVVNDERMIPNIIAKFDLMKEIANTLIKNHPCQLHDGSFHDCEYDGYDDEYILILDENNNIWVEPMLRDGKYLNPVDPTFIHEDCNSKIISKNCDVFFIPFEISENS